MANDDCIKRSDAIKALYQGYEKLGLIVYRVSCIGKINQIPAADVEPVVHCKDCRHGTPEGDWYHYDADDEEWKEGGDVHCSWWDYPMSPMGFCSKATRKEGDDDA